MSASLANWRPPPLPPQQPIAGRYAVLEPLDTARHGPELEAACAEDGAGDMWHYLPVGPFETGPDLRAWLAAMSAETDPLPFAVRDLDRGAVGGLLTLLRIKPESGSIEVGYITFAPRLQRTRAASEAVILLARLAFDLGYRRFEWKCDAANMPSRRAASRFGFSYEGIFRQATVVKQRNRDTAWFAMIDAERPALEKAWSDWLDPANFDAAGQQKKRLSEMTGPLLYARDPAQ